jgi:hypothetical protein
MMRTLAALLTLIASPSLAAADAGWNPSARYVAAGQDEPGYRAWHGAQATRPERVAGFHRYLERGGVAFVVPTWQLLRTASQWHRCSAEPFEIPPPQQWPNIVQTLRYVRDHVVPAVGPVEAVSAYRNPLLNACAGGARESVHQHFAALDLVPLRPTSRETLMGLLCAAHGHQGERYGAGLGFYVGLRFHVDSTRFRSWLADGSGLPGPCLPSLATAATAPK